MSERSRTAIVNRIGVEGAEAGHGGHEGDVASFVATMPRTYRHVFSPDAIALHAGIVERRGSSAARVEMWREIPEHVAALCVVADDSPGLLARISAAFVAHDVDVIAAQAYCRRAGLSEGERVEAVDFFWIRKLSPSTGGVVAVQPRDVAAFGETLGALVRGRASFERAVSFARAVRTAGESTRVRFENDVRDGAMVLTVQGADRPGILFAITDALFRERVRISRSDVATHDGKILDRFALTELDGSPLRRARLLGIQTAVLGALERGT